MLTKVPPSYAFVQYNEDEDIQAFIDAFNTLAQEYVTFFAAVSLPVYTGLSGALLDWVAAGLYGVLRPTGPDTSTYDVGPINTWTPNQIPINGGGPEFNSSFAAVSDDIFKRVLTWRLYRGDGKTFTIPWLKRRVERFLSGPNGIDPGVAQTYDVSVELVGGTVVEIRLIGYDDPDIAAMLSYLLRTKVLETPFQYAINLVL